MKGKTFFQIINALILCLLTLLLIYVRDIGDTSLHRLSHTDQNKATSIYWKTNGTIGFLQTTNTSPTVKIVNPTDGGNFEVNKRIPYKITISDVEDGESKYDEIDGNRAWLEVKYQSKSNLKKQRNTNGQEDLSGIIGIITSNCTNCHSFDEVLIGPSIYEISARYRSTNPNMDVIIDRIRNGSSGFWGDKDMPSHPELTKQEIKAMLLWITRNGAMEDVKYYKGLEGTFELDTAGVPIQDRIFTLTARYTDKANDGGKKNTGQDAITIYPKN